MIGKRISQGIRSLRPTPVPSDELATAKRHLTASQFSRFQQQPDFDQIHQARVCRWLEDQGVTDPDLLTASLLHDVGKSASGRVTTFDRTARVLLRRVSPSLLEKLASPDVRWRWNGLVLAVHHPKIGAGIARDLGASDRTCWLIASHESANVGNDPGLALLQQADSAA